MRILLAAIAVGLVFAATAMARSYPHVGGYKHMTNFQANRLQ
jgi:hypothetical protein